MVGKNTLLSIIMASTIALGSTVSAQDDISPEVGDYIYARVTDGVSTVFYDQGPGEIIPGGLRPGVILRLRVAPNNLAEIVTELTEEGTDEETWWPAALTNAGRVPYISLDDVEIIDNFDPITINPAIYKGDKLAIVLRDEEPDMILVEGDKIIAHFPVVLGEGVFSTPVGDHRIYRTRFSKNMPMLPGVGATMYFEYSCYAAHSSYWWQWDQMNKGFYGSHGCTNLPDFNWFRIATEDGDVSVAHFMYNWVSTNIDYDESIYEEAMIQRNTQAFIRAEETVRYIVIDKIEDLLEYDLPYIVREEAGPRANGLSSWDTIINQYNEMDNWLLPQWENGRYVLQEIDYEKLPPPVRNIDMRIIRKISDEEHLAVSETTHPALERLINEQSYGHNELIAALSYLGIDDPMEFMHNTHFYASETLNYYLQTMRRGSWGTTIIRYDETDGMSLAGIGLVTWYTGMNGYMRTLLAIEEIVQIAAWQPIIDLENMGYFGDNPREVIWQLNYGTVRSFGEIVQHSALRLAFRNCRSGEEWLGNSYKIYVLDRLYNEDQSVEALNDLRNIINGMGLVRIDGSLYYYADEYSFLADLTDSETLLHLTTQVKEETGYDIWDFTGLRKPNSSFQIPPAAGLLDQVEVYRK